VAVAADTIGQRVRRLRVLRGLLQRDVADFANKSERWMRYLENDDRRARLDHQTALWMANGLRVDLAVVLALAPIPANLRAERPSPQRAISAVPESDTVRLSTTEARLVEAARIHYEQMYRRVGGLATGAQVDAFVRAHRHLADDAYSDEAGKEIYRALGGLIAIAGICAYDSDAHESAERHYREALALARASGDRAFGAYIYGLRGNQALLLSHNEHAVEASEVAVQTAGSHLSSALRADLWALQAKAFARMADTDRALRHMRLAEDAATRIRRCEEPPETDYIQPGLIEEQLADALRSMGDLRSALLYAERSTTMTTHKRGLANRLVILTRIAIASGDLDYAADATGRLLDAAQGLESQRFRDRLRSIRRSLAPHRASVAVREVADALDSRLILPLEGDHT
jgi:transcriptional regulator with XRE-family HTH domain